MRPRIRWPWIPTIRSSVSCPTVHCPSRISAMHWSDLITGKHFHEWTAHFLFITRTPRFLVILRKFFSLAGAKMCSLLLKYLALFASARVQERVCIHRPRSCTRSHPSWPSDTSTCCVSSFASRGEADEAAPPPSHQALLAVAFIGIICVAQINRKQVSVQSCLFFLDCQKKRKAFAFA